MELRVEADAVASVDVYAGESEKDMQDVVTRQPQEQMESQSEPQMGQQTDTYEDHAKEHPKGLEVRDQEMATQEDSDHVELQQKEAEDSLRLTKCAELKHILGARHVRFVLPKPSNLEKRSTWGEIYAADIDIGGEQLYFYYSRSSEGIWDRVSYEGSLTGVKKWLAQRPYSRPFEHSGVSPCRDCPGYKPRESVKVASNSSPSSADIVCVGSSSSPAGFNLLALPRDLRDLIYLAVATDAFRVKRHERSLPAVAVSSALPRVNRQVRREFARVLHRISSNKAFATTHIVLNSLDPDDPHFARDYLGSNEQLLVEFRDQSPAWNELRAQLISVRERHPTFNWPQLTLVFHTNRRLDWDRQENILRIRGYGSLNVIVKQEIRRGYSVYYRGRYKNCLRYCLRSSDTLGHLLAICDFERPEPEREALDQLYWYHAVDCKHSSATKRAISRLWPARHSGFLFQSDRYARGEYDYGGEEQ